MSTSPCLHLFHVQHVSYGEPDAEEEGMMNAGSSSSDEDEDIEAVKSMMKAEASSDDDSDLEGKGRHEYSMCVP